MLLTAKEIDKSPADKKDSGKRTLSRSEPVGEVDLGRSQKKT